LIPPSSGLLAGLKNQFFKERQNGPASPDHSAAEVIVIQNANQSTVS
jgi:hypothetical protein